MCSWTYEVCNQLEIFLKSWTILKTKKKKGSITILLLNKILKIIGHNNSYFSLSTYTTPTAFRELSTHAFGGKREIRVNASELLEVVHYPPKTK